MDDLLALAERVARRLIARGETIGIAESSTGGLIAASLLAMPGASACVVGGGVIYTGTARHALLGITLQDMEGLRPSTEAYAGLLARKACARLGTDWGLGESGAAGPTGNRYGDAPGHTCLAVAGVADRQQTIETASADRWANMQAFARAGLILLDDLLATS